jgi:hypothetical protein
VGWGAYRSMGGVGSRVRFGHAHLCLRHTICAGWHRLAQAAQAWFFSGVGGAVAVGEGG